jgi:hypothetical protein
MFKAEIITYDEKAIKECGDCEPEILWEGRCETIVELAQDVAEWVCLEASRLLDGYSVTVSIGKVKVCSGGKG